MWQVYRHNQTSVSCVNYHCVWSSRRRRKVLKGMVAIRLKELIEEICQTLEVKILELEVQPNYVHLLLNCPPTLAPHQVIHRIKGHTARHLRQEFEQLQTLPSMWTRFYFVSTAETLSQETITQYVATQKKQN